jgi:hypothetical protein
MSDERTPTTEPEHRQVYVNEVTSGCVCGNTWPCPTAEPVTEAGRAMLYATEWPYVAYATKSLIRAIETEAAQRSTAEVERLREQYEMQFDVFQRDLADRTAEVERLREAESAWAFAETHSRPDHDDGNVRVERGAWNRLRAALAEPDHDDGPVKWMPADRPQDDE